MFEYKDTSMIKTHLCSIVLIFQVGGTGTAKTVTALMFFDSLNVDREMVKKVAFSYATTGGTFQKTIENELDKRGGKMFGPPGSKNMTVFLDDINMPMVNEWGYVKSCTCWLYSLCNFQYRQQSENTCSDNFDC